MDYTKRCRAEDLCRTKPPSLEVRRACSPPNLQARRYLRKVSYYFSSIVLVMMLRWCGVVLALYRCTIDRYTNLGKAVSGAAHSSWPVLPSVALKKTKVPAGVKDDGLELATNCISVRFQVRIYSGWGYSADLTPS